MNILNRLKLNSRTSKSNLYVSNRKGFTLMEILITLAIIAIISTISVETYYNLREKQAILKDSDSIVSIIEKTRNMSLNRKNDSAYGVSFASSTVTIFSGISRASGNDISKYNLEPNIVKISKISLSSNATEIGFAKTSGMPNATGTVTLSTSAYTKTVTISGTGIIEVK